MALINIQYTADIQQLNAKLDQIIQKQEQLISSSQKAGKEMSDAAKKSSEGIDFLNNSLQKLSGAIAAAFSVQKVIEFGKSVFDAERRMELLQNRINFLVGSTDKGNEAFLRMSATARKLGLDLETTLSGFADFGIAATQAGMAVQQAERIFISVASGLRAAGASSLQTQRAFYALQQMMSKGVVAAEELRRQLGEALPGANELMVKAYNRLHPQQEITNRQFTKMQEEGKIISREILPEFAKVIEETFAPALAGKANSLDASVNRVTSAWLQFKLAVGDTEVFKSATKSVEGLLDAINIALTDDSLSRLERFMIITSAPRLSSMSEEEMANAVMGIEKVFKQALDRQRQRSDASVATARAEEEALASLSSAYEKLNNSQREAEMKRAISTIETNRQIIKQADEAIKKEEEKLKSSQSLVEMLVEQRNPLKRITEEQKQQLQFAISKRDEAKKSLELIKEEKQQAANTISVLQGAIKQYALLDQARQDSADKLEKVENQGLRDFIAIQKIRLAQAVKGSEEELGIRQVMLVAEAQLRAENEKLTAKERLAIMEQAYREAEELTKKFNDTTFLQYQAAIKSGEKFAKELRKTFREQLYATISDPMQLELEKTIDYYNDLIKEAGDNAELIIQLEEAKYAALDAIRQKFADKDQDREDTRLRRLARSMSQTISAVGDLIQQQIQLDIDANNQQLKNLEERYEKGLLSEEAYEKQKKDIQRRVFEDEKSMQIARAVMSGANAIISILGNPTLLPLAPVLIPLTVGLTAQQISLIQSQTPGFKDGVIDLKGPGTETSDSIVARLSRGESVMTAKETKKYKDVLEAIREDRLPSLIAEKYLIPAYEASIDKGSKSDVSKSSLELAFQTAELVQAVKGNKVINLSEKSVKSIASAMSKGRMMDKKMRRRGL